MLIYKITNIVNNKVYIGLTTKTLEQRKEWHRNAFVSGGDTYLYSAMRKFGWDNFTFEVVDDSATTEAELQEQEKFYIKMYNSMVEGYNMTEGGESNPMSCARSKAKHDSVMRDPAIRAKISASMKASYAKRGGPSLEHRKHLSEEKKNLYSMERGNVVRAKFKASYKFTAEHQAAMIKGRQKGVYCIDESGHVVAEFNTVKDGAQWWLRNGYEVKSYYQLCDKIKESFVQDKYIKGIKWVYKDQQAGHRA